MIYVGIDPGLSGAIAFIFPDGTVSTYDTPVIKVSKNGKNRNVYLAGAMHDHLTQLEESFPGHKCHVALEKVGPMPGNGAAAMFSMGHGLGLWEGLIVASGLPLTYVIPQAWKKMFGLDRDKNKSILKAKQLFPTADITLKKHDGRAEALLMAEYLRRTLHSHDSTKNLDHA